MKAEHLTLGILFISVLILIGGALSGSFSLSEITSPKEQRFVSPTQVASPSPSSSPPEALSPVEDNPERIENDDNPGESNRRGRNRGRGRD